MGPTSSLHMKPTTPFRSTSTLTYSVKRSREDPMAIVKMRFGISIHGLRSSWPELIFLTDMEAGNASMQHRNNNLVTIPIRTNAVPFPSRLCDVVKSVSLLILLRYLPKSMLKSAISKRTILLTGDSRRSKSTNTVLVVRFLPNVLEPMTIWATQMWKISPASTKALIVKEAHHRLENPENSCAQTRVIWFASCLVN